jgi:sugar transferase (PEP-CTERM/EpsH1 system associated)
MAAGVPGRIHGEHGWDASDPAGMRVRYRVVRRLYRPFVRHYVALSKHLESYLIEHVAVTRSRVSQIYNGVDIVRFRPVSSSVRAPIPGCPFIEPGLWLLGTVGRLDPVKDQISLARTFVRIVGSDEIARARMRLVIVGEGKVRADIERVLSDAGVRDLAWLAGERNDIPDVLAGLECFVLPSLGEGISNTILEAMSTRLPVVATRVGGNEELVDHECTGTLVEPRDGDALARAILRYFRDPALAWKHALAARRRVEQSFSLENMVADYDRLYCSMLPGRTATRLPVGRPDTTLR